MLGFSQSTAVGRVAPGEVDTLFIPRTPRPGRYGLVLCHGFGGKNSFYTAPYTSRLIQSLTSAGIACISGDMGGETWGNAVAQTRIEQMASVLQGAVPSLATGKVALLGVSMGAAAATIYAQANPGKVASVVGFIPLLDMKALYEESPTHQSWIASAWGVTYPEPLPSQADNAAHAMQQVSVPSLFAYSDSDTLVNPEWVTQYASQIGATIRMDDALGSGHTDVTIGETPISAIGEFLIENGC